MRRSLPCHATTEQAPPCPAMPQPARTGRAVWGCQRQRTSSQASAMPSGLRAAPQRQPSLALPSPAEPRRAAPSGASPGTAMPRHGISEPPGRVSGVLVVSDRKHLAVVSRPLPPPLSIRLVVLRRRAELHAPSRNQQPIAADNLACQIALTSEMGLPIAFQRMRGHRDQGRNALPFHHHQANNHPAD